ncbi:MAG: PAS domain-containing sensor histidine kinase, partial [Bacteroidetes bacterium]
SISLFVIVVGFTGLITIQSIKIGYGNISAKSLPLDQHLNNMKVACLRLISSATEYAYIRTESNDTSQLSPLKMENDLIQQSCNSCHNSFNKYERLVNESFPEDLVLLKRIRESGVILQTLASEFLEMKKQGISGSVALEKKEALEGGETEFLSAVNNAIDDLNNQLEREKSQLNSTISSSFKIIIVFVLLSFFISVLFGILMSRAIARPIIKLTQLNVDFREGNLDVAAEIKSADELGVLGRSFNEMTKKIKLLILQLENEVKLTRHAEELIKKSSQQIKSILEVAGEGIIGLDAFGNQTFVNPMVTVMLGYKAEELYGKHSHTLFHHSYHDGTLYPEEKCPVYETLKDGKIHNGEEYFWKKDGTGFPVAFSSLPIIENDMITGAVVTFRDITKRKLEEEEIKLRNEQLQNINDEKDKFFSIIAHDLRSPFNNFLGLTQMMTEELNSLSYPEIQKIAESMRKSATNLYTLLGNLLEWSKMQRGMTDFKTEKFRLPDQLKNCVELISAPAGKKDIVINFDVQDNLEITADKHMFDTVIRNLVSNAIKFTPHWGTITVSASPANENSIAIKINDTGIGMNSDMVNKLFRLNADISRKGTDGEPSTGLGLLLCKEFIEKHGGNIWVESEAGKGSTFSFTIPGKSSMQ